jgi:hypothetical protein
LSVLISVGDHTWKSRVVMSYAQGATPASFDQAAKHTWRTAVSLNLAAGDAPPYPAADSYEVFDFVFSGAPIPGDASTHYWWRAARFPISAAAHVIGWEANITDADRPFVHHVSASRKARNDSGVRSMQILVYRCMASLTVSDLAYVGDGYNGRAPSGLLQCNVVNPLVAWAIGGAPVSLPADVGIPVDETTFMLLELHWNNPNLLNLTISSGIRLLYSSALRPVDAGLIEAGAVVDVFLQVPPGLSATTRSAFCFSQCTRALPASGVVVFAIFLHMHTAGTRIETMRIDANGTEMRTSALASVGE